MAPSPPNTTATRPALHSRVVMNPLGLGAASMFIMGLLLLPVAALKASAGNWQRAAFAGVLGLVLLFLNWRKVARRNQPMLLTCGPDSLHLEPVGRSLAQSIPAETIPLTSIVAYKYWLRLLRWRVFAQYHLRLELADGRVLHLADQPVADPAGTVRLDAVDRRLARRGKTAPRRRQLFFLTQTARVLLWLSWVALAAGLGLLALGQSAGIVLAVLGTTYWSAHYLGRGSDEITA